MYTIKDLVEGRVCVSNDGTLEELKKVLRKAFPYYEYPIEGVNRYYFKATFGEYWTSGDKPYYSHTPTQSVKDFLKQIEEPWVPKRGDRVLASWDCVDNVYNERIFVTEIKNGIRPYVLVSCGDEENFKSGLPFDVIQARHIKPIPTPQPQTELTMDEIAEKFGIDVNNLKIVK